MTTLNIFGKIHFLLISENKFFMNENVMELQIFMKFIIHELMFVNYNTILMMIIEWSKYKYEFNIFWELYNNSWDVDAMKSMAWVRSFS